MSPKIFFKKKSKKLTALFDKAAVGKQPLIAGRLCTPNHWSATSGYLPAGD
jgi:hypothetical protein